MSFSAMWADAISISGGEFEESVYGVFIAGIALTDSIFSCVIHIIPSGQLVIQWCLSIPVQC